MGAAVPKTKIAILGGGIAGLTTAYELIAQPGGQEKYDVTVYQLGWRVGGKGASGRNASAGQRIEEHGLHVWSGFYENAFALMRRCYPELRRTPGTDPLAVVFPVDGHPEISPAFRPHNCTVIQEFINGRWLSWVQETPFNSELPGDGAEMSLWDFFKVAIDWLVDLVEELLALNLFPVKSSGLVLPDWLGSIVENLRKDLGALVSSVPADTGPRSARFDPARGNWLESDLARLAQDLVARLGPNPADHSGEDHDAIARLIDRFRKWLTTAVEDKLLEDNALRRLFILIDMISTITCGVLRDGVLIQGTTAIDKYDFREWLTRNGAHDLTAYSGLVRGYYDYCFAYRQGDPSLPCMAAGCGLLHLTRLTLQIKGAVFWKMQAGMGDTVFTPLYLVLRNLGVKFEFFHEVKNLRLSPDKSYVEQIELNLQATVTEQAKQTVHQLKGRDYTGEYWPLCMVKDLPCWPSTPDYDQLQEGAALRAAGIDLECPWSNWPGVGARTLVCGRDFDQVVLAMSHGPLAHVTSELSQASSSWKTMVERVLTTQTVGVQLWCRQDWKELGWPHPVPLITAYAQPIQTWGDFSQVLPREDWPAHEAANSVSYLCGNLPDPGVIPGFSDHGFPQQQHDRVRDLAWQWTTDNSAVIWPNGAPPFSPTGLEWSRLADVNGGNGRERFNAQFFRANISPSERYVLTVPGDTQYRMKQGKTPFSNVFVAGDYVFTGILGSIEASVMTGMMASRAISGWPAKIYGEVDA